MDRGSRHGFCSEAPMSSSLKIPRGTSSQRRELRIGRRRHVKPHDLEHHFSRNSYPGMIFMLNEKSHVCDCGIHGTSPATRNVLVSVSKSGNQILKHQYQMQYWLLTGCSSDAKGEVRNETHNIWCIKLEKCGIVDQEDSFLPTGMYLSARSPDLRRMPGPWPRDWGYCQVAIRTFACTTSRRRI